MFRKFSASFIFCCGKCSIRHLRVAQFGPSRPEAQLVGGPDQHVHAVDADDAHEDKSHVAHEKAGVLDGVRHGQDAGADVALQQVDDGVKVSAKYDAS